MSSPLITIVRKLGACGQADEFLRGRVSADKAWRECPNTGWMLWLLSASGKNALYSKVKDFERERKGDVCDNTSCDRPQCITFRGAGGLVAWNKRFKEHILKLQPTCPRIPKRCLK